jgi:crossover junction endodeoxyribonuclease RuvC
MAITGNGAASKEQVAAMLQRMLNISDEIMHIQLDATDALAAAYCHFIQMGKPEQTGKKTTWKEYVEKLEREKKIRK